MTIDRTSCPVCDLRAGQMAPRAPEVRELKNDVYEVKCPRCGPFRITLEDWVEAKTDEQRLRTSSFIRHRHERGQSIPTLCLEPATGRIEDAFTYDDIEPAFPKGIQQIHDELLRTIAAMSRRDRAYHGQARIGPLEAPIASTFDHTVTGYHLGALVQEGLLHPLGSSASELIASLSKRGWKHAEDLERGSAERPRQAFVAMWFPRKDKDPGWHDILERAWDDGLRAGAKDAGYDASRIDMKEHNNKICDEIIAEIRRSRFVIADFTGNRGGVYYEAGYALGLGKPVIWCCHRKWHDENELHFDTRQYNHIMWGSPEDLRAKLRARIGATIVSELR